MDRSRREKRLIKCEPKDARFAPIRQSFHVRSKINRADRQECGLWWLAYRSLQPVTMNQNSSRVLALAFASAILAAPKHTLACSPPFPDLGSTLPAQGETYPSNAAIIFNGFFISFDNITATIDGAPATLVPADDGFSAGYPGIAMRLDPAPVEGQIVAIEGSYCNGCPSTLLEYTVGAADTPPPEAPQRLQYDVHDHVAFNGRAKCR